MKIQKKFWILVAILSLAGSAFAAQGTPAAKPEPSRKPASAMALHEVTGTVVSADATKLVISHVVKGKSEETSFMLGPETAKSGKLEPGLHAMIKYRMDNGQNVATLVKTSAPAHVKHASRKW